jgi:serine/threonine protein kinase
MMRYRIERLIGMGGLAMVYEARWILPGGHSMPVACKLVRDDRRDIPRYREYARQEAAISMQLSHNHPNLVTVFDYFEDMQGRPCLVLEMVDGGSVADLLGTFPGLPFSVTRRIARKVLAALAYLHGAHVLHRDLSPCNVLVSTAGDVKVSDLNLVKVMEHGQAHTQTFRGKPAYASPEALACATIDARSDLYSFGAVLYQMLTGKLLRGEEMDPTGILERARREDFAPLSEQVPRDLAELATGLLRAEPDARRPQRAIEALALLRDGGEPVADRAELGGLVTMMQRRRGKQPDGNVIYGHPGEILAPGHVLVPRPGIMSEQGAPELPTAAGQAMPGVLPPRGTESVTTDELLQSRLRVPPSNHTKSMEEERPVRRRRGRRVARAALIGALMSACLVLGAFLQGRFLAGNGPASPPLTNVPVQQQPGPGPGPSLPVWQPVDIPAEPPAVPAEQRLAEVPVHVSAPARKRHVAPRKRPQRADSGMNSAPEPPWYEIPRVDRTEWHIYLADGLAEEPAEEKKP